MCGIAGVLELNSKKCPSRPELELMANQLSHRGPDGHGFYQQGRIGLAHTRLSIIDLKDGAQPIHNEDKTVWVVFNGEIFNYIELKDELRHQGHQFYTHTDTEVIVHLYEQYGEDFISHLNGQFAIALWDKKLEKLILARDRVGIAPLFYCKGNGRLFFASEVKAMLPLFSESPSLNLPALDQLMTFWSPVSPHTIFKGVFELSPGMIMVIDSKGERLHRYWDWQFPQHKAEYLQQNETQLTQELHDLLVDATQIRLRSDVPVGAYLSGGLDSSVLTSLIHHHSDAPLRTFSIGFDSGSLDESNFQQQMITHLNADHSRIQCSNSDIAQDFVETIFHTESPVLRTAPAPMRLLSGLVKDKGYKVVLTGEGADEVLGGYDIFKEAKIRQFWAKQPDSSWRPLLLKRLYPYLDISTGKAQSYSQKFFGVGLETPDLAYFSHLPRWNTTAKVKTFFSEAVSQQLNHNAVNDLNSSLPDEIIKWHCFNRGQYVETKSLMAGYLLCSQGDRMLMANSVEGRFPFLDHRVIEFANRLPPKFKMKVLNEKFLLKKAMKQYLPETIINRHKQPYRAPDAAAFFGEGDYATPEYVEDLLSEEKLACYGYFDPKRVSMLVKKARRGGAVGQKDNQALVGILSTQIWHHLFIDNFAKNFKQN